MGSVSLFTEDGDEGRILGRMADKYDRLSGDRESTQKVTDPPASARGGNKQIGPAPRSRAHRRLLEVCARVE